MNVTSEWSVRSAGKEDLNKIRSLYKSVWSYNRPEQFDQWRYFSSPDCPIPAALAEDGDRLAGSYTLWPTELKIGKSVFLGAQSMDTMTHPDYQGQGVFTKLAEACYEIAADRGFKVLYGFPNPLSYPGFVKRLGWTHTGDITHWIRLIKPSGHSKIPGPIKPIADLATRLLPRGSKRDFEIVLEKPTEQDIEPLLTHWRSESGTCRIERSPEWLSWRYASEAENDYQWVAAYRNGVLKAAAVWGRQNSAWGAVADNRAHLVELLGQDPQALEAVLAAIINQAQKSGAILLETVSNIDRICRALRWAGFYRHRQAPLIIRGLGETNFDTDILTHNNWRIMGGDLDTF